MPSRFGVYHDPPYCTLDTERAPADRPELCINCAQNWRAHHNWACPGVRFISSDWSRLLPGERYLTKSMVNAVGVKSIQSGTGISLDDDVFFFQSTSIPFIGRATQAPPADPTKDETKWQAWAHNVPGECKCGIPRNMCEYHR